MRFGNDKSAVFTNAIGSTGRVSGFADMAISFETLIKHYRLKEMGEAQNLLPKLQAFPKRSASIFHTFRDTFATLLKVNGEDVKAGQELLMHAKNTATMNTYAQDVTELKHEARRPDGHWEVSGRGGSW